MTPDEFTNQEFYLDVGDGHQLYVQDWGNKKARLPIIYLHGGPGDGCGDRDKRNYDPRKHRVIFHDQRGSGKSLPFGSLKHNSTPELVEDIETLAASLNLTRFILVGGSWGSTLALAYGVTHPGRIAGMVLNGVFTATKAELDWFTRGGWQEFFPEVWQEFLEATPAKHQQNPLEYHLQQGLSSDSEAAKQSAYAFANMELGLLKLDDHYTAGKLEDFDPTSIFIQLHYNRNQFFLREGHILRHAGKLQMPVYLIAGRYDMVTPPVTAYNLAEALPDAEIVWTINGHIRQHEAKNIQTLLVNRLVEDSQ